MRIYITRHGQVAPKESYGDVQFPAGDPPLTQIGREQATRLGAYLKHIGFCGKIYSSPYARALETAECIATQTGSKIYPTAFMREIMKTQEGADTLKGLTLEEIKEKFTCIAEDAELPYPWWGKTFDTEEDVLARVGKGITELAPKEDVLMVGHGASAGHLINFLEIPKKAGRDLYNCCLSVLDTENENKCQYMDVAHLSYHLIGANTVMLKEKDGEKFNRFMAEELNVPEFVKTTNSLKLLHIGDTSSYTYSYYEKLIAKTKPNVILHTGDLVDEVKAGRMINTKEEYTAGVKQLSQILKNSGAKIYVVPGNNDLEDVIKEELPFAEVLKPNSELTLANVSMTVCHAWYELKTERTLNLYGHGLTGETWKPEMNTKEGVCHYNVIWGPKLILLPENETVEFIRPEDYR